MADQTDRITDTLAAARLRLMIGRALMWATRALATSGLAALVAVGALRFSDVEVSWEMVVVSTLVVTAIGTALLTLLRPPAPSEVAACVDQAFGLADRLSTLVTLDEGTRKSPMGQAVLADTRRHLADVVVAERVGITMPRRPWLAVIPLVAAVGMSWWLHPLFWVQQKKVQLQENTEQAQKIVEQANELSKRLEERKKALGDKPDAEELKQLLGDMEKATRDLSERPKGTVKDALVQLNDLAKNLEKEREKLGGIDQMARSLGRIKSAGQGPAEKLSQALKNSDFSAASKEMNSIADRLRKNATGAQPMTKDEKEKLARQLDTLQKQLADMSNLEQRAEQLRKSLPPELLKQELEKLKQDKDRLKELAKLAKQLAKAAEAAKKADGMNKAKDNDKAAMQNPKQPEEKGKGEKKGTGGEKNDKEKSEGDKKTGEKNDKQKSEQEKKANGKQGEKGEKGEKGPPSPDGQPGALEKSADEQLADALDEAKKTLEELAGDADQRELLDEMLRDLENAKEGMQQPMPMRGIGGAGIGAGEREINKDDNVRTRRVKAKTEFQKGQVFFDGLTDGKNKKGESILPTTDIVEAAAKAADDGITRQKVPREYRDHTRQYFESITKPKKDAP